MLEKIKKELIYATIMLIIIPILYYIYLLKLNVIIDKYAIISFLEIYLPTIFISIIILYLRFVYKKRK